MAEKTLIPGSKVSGRELRRRLNGNQQWLNEQVVPTLNRLLQNERVTIEKVTAVETWMTQWQALSFWQRLQWLVQGVSHAPTKETQA